MKHKIFTYSHGGGETLNGVDSVVNVCDSLCLFLYV